MTVVLFVAVFLACAVEAVEALTIVLAVGVTRQWRSTWQGVAAGLILLAVLVAVFGSALHRIPIGGLRLVVGGLLLIFGLQWLRKAILRAAGYRALHDEAVAYQREVAAASSASAGGRWSVTDWYSFVVAFKAVLLEGLEVVFIVLTFAAGRAVLGWVVTAALCAVVVVVAVGVAVRQPLTRVPENAMKFVVGTLLCTFGIFWAGEGAGSHWPGGDVFLLAILGFVAVSAAGAVPMLRAARTRIAGVAG